MPEVTGVGDCSSASVGGVAFRTLLRDRTLGANVSFLSAVPALVVLGHFQGLETIVPEAFELRAQ